MPESAVYRPHPEAPARATLRSETAAGAWTGLHAQRFELVSRGDFVPGILYQGESSAPESEAGSPLLLIQHRTADASDASYLTCAAPWVKRGLAVASIDLPLHGMRSSPKLSARLFDGVRRIATGEDLDLDTAALVEEFARQTTSDLIRTLDALSALPGIDGQRIGFMGFGLGAVAGAYLLAHDARPRAAVLAYGGGGRGPAHLDPVTYLERAKNVQAKLEVGCEILVVAAEGHERVTSEHVDGMFKAAPEPKELLRFPGDQRALPKQALSTIETFLSKRLDF